MGSQWGPIDTPVGSEFLAECEKIATDNNLFANFKRNPVFTKVIANDHKTGAEMNNCYDSILKNPALVAKMSAFKRNDILGQPYIVEYPATGLVSPGTLYLVAILGNIIENFGDISNFDVVEIGSGYGGQAEILLEWGVKSYTCIDVPETLNLCGKYLTTLGHGNVKFYTPGQIPADKRYDLVISNWCLSEMTWEGLKFYLDKIISKSANGYFLMNIWDTFTKDATLALIRQHFYTVIDTPDKFTLLPEHKANWLLTVKGNK